MGEWTKANVTAEREVDGRWVLWADLPDDDVRIADFQSLSQNANNQANCERAAALWNAMQGIPDPAKFIVDMQLAFQALRRGPELNMSNYTADDVAELNANATEAYLLMRPYLEAVIAKQALAAKPEEAK